MRPALGRNDRQLRSRESQKLPLSDANDTVSDVPRFRLPQRLVPIVFDLLISGLVSCIVSGLITLLRTGLDAGYPLRWLHIWLLAWTTAFPLVVFLGPRVRRLVERFSSG